MANDDLIGEFIAISHYAGMREDLIQAGGGNSSVKNADGRMMIKASGYKLAEISPLKGYAEVDYRIITAAFRNRPIDSFTKEDGKRLLEQARLSDGKPSIETFLHAITAKVTLHTHPVLVNALASRQNGMETLARMFPSALLIDYATPGIELAIEYFSAWREKGEKSIYCAFLKNHGLIVSGETAEDVITNTEMIVSKIAQELHYDNAADRAVTTLWRLYHDVLKKLGNEVAQEGSGDIVYKASSSIIMRALNKGNGTLKHVSLSFCPDCVVYCGKRILHLEQGREEDCFKAFFAEHGKPVIVVHNNFAYVLAQSIKDAKEIESLLSFACMVCELNDGHTMNLLTDREADFLLGWDEEKYRRMIK